VEVSNPGEVDEIFDKISYRKGASVIRMLHSVLGEEVFTRGIRTYMQTYKYSNACTQVEGTHFVHFKVPSSLVALNLAACISSHNPKSLVGYGQVIFDWVKYLSILNSSDFLTVFPLPSEPYFNKYNISDF